ncbi:MAG: transcriptional regulator, TetR family [Microbacterium sp.]|uniref:TetR/AcrR family transcriptional regulator n=1 Tax=Microbacterium sp. TaxID=51671 RepID=UPI002631DB1E|nr:TetR/AcrR family transcriptional regulator [Microbacterium sp.]MDF2561738.1 transcriptional regulator, TetR family [Microbacterium sp.]
MTERAHAERHTTKGTRTKARIVEAAAQLMLQEGVEGTRMEDVRRAAAVSSSQIYHYFADKQALVRAVVTHQAATVVARQEVAFAQMDTIEGLRRWRDALVAYQRTVDFVGGCPLGSLASELAELDPASREAARAGFEAWEGRIRHALGAMRDRGELAMDPDPLATALLAAVEGGLLLSKLERSTRVLEGALDAIIGLLASSVNESSVRLADVGRRAETGAP